ncbi:lysophospholipid acyltransferase 7 [Anoplophora glabripennis]|uniref:lysophospholipid acyltransferase 7 n=1 Tax=Anoplophora glabripennis TaxID=217634 RepID=UPI0008755AD2|nr:lysophospholipid acyltransferase 7 [Anoplophora glabripennis]
MIVEDIIYLSLLFFSMGFGVYYRTIENPDLKKKVGALIGFVIVFIVSGFHCLHVAVSTLINACIILYTDKRKCHIYSFIFSFLYLFFFRATIYFGIPYPPSHTNLVQMMVTLKIIGLAFEVNTSYYSKKKRDKGSKTEEEKLQDELCDIDVQFLDVFCYVYNYCGVLTGPYFRYRTFLDHLHKPYHKYDDYKIEIFKKLYLIPILGAIHVFTNYYWPISYLNTDEFYTRAFLYRYWYIWPAFIIFRSRIYLGLILTEMVCTMGGLGVYPAFSKPKSGHGPTENLKQLKELAEPDDFKNLEYSYETIHCLNVYESDFAPTMREAMKHWNITVQYWLATYIYKRCPFKKFRTGVTMFLSALWHGMYTGYYLCIATVPLALVYEDVWVKLLLKDTTGLALKASKLLLLFLKMQMFSYQATAFVLLEVWKIYRYYSSVYHCVPILYVGLYFLGRYLLKQKRLRGKKAELDEAGDKEVKTKIN